MGNFVRKRKENTIPGRGHASWVFRVYLYDLHRFGFIGVQQIKDVYLSDVVEHYKIVLFKN